MPPKAKAATPALPHGETCKGPRVEAYKALSPGGSEVTVTRCMECGAQTTK